MCVVAGPHVRNFQQSRNIVHGHKLELTCQAWGWPVPHVTWYRGQTELNSTVDPRVTLADSSGIHNAKLIIEDIGSVPGDRGHYTCVATSPSGERYYYNDGNNATIFVRVKGL
jgi:Immunoglobulin I-set domain